MTRRTHLEETLRKLSSAVEYSPSSILITNNQGILEYVNPAFQAISGYSSDEVLGQNPRVLKSGLHAASMFENLWNTITSGHVWRGELCNRRKDGSLYWDLVAIAPVKDADGGITHFIGIQHDVTDTKDMELQVRDLREHLLRVSRLSELGQMASALAHEINQPLAAALNYVNTGRKLTEGIESSTAQKTHDLLSKAATQVERAGTIIHGLKSITEKRKPERKLADINRAVEEACGIALIGTAGQGIETSLTLASGLPRLRIDTIQVQQVVLNLVRNGIEALANAKERRLHVATAPDGNDAVEVTIRDSGAGLPHSVADKVFEPFVTTKPEGVGIGLSISRSIIEGHGGRLWATQTPGGGTTFHFTLPSASEQAEATESDE